MKRLIVAASFAVIPAVLAAQAQTAQPAVPVAPAARVARVAPVAPAPSHEVFGVPEQNALVKQYCTGCHSDRGKAGQLTLASFDATKAADADHLVTTEKMIRKLRAGMMPPATARRPEPEQVKALVTALEARVDRAALVSNNPGSRPFQRLNRAEYARAVKDMLGIDIDVAGMLPADTLSNGFDNVADAQNFSTTLLESYLRAAAKVTALAIGDKNAAAT
jgi:mono/diheme cytochrome c family protein